MVAGKWLELASLMIDNFLKEWNIDIKDQRELFLDIANVLRENKSLLKESPKFLTKDLATFCFPGGVKVADDATFYGVCLHVSEFVHRPPGVLSTASPLHSSGGGSHFLVSVPRCYCLLTRVPFLSYTLRC